MYIYSYSEVLSKDPYIYHAYKHIERKEPVLEITRILILKFSKHLKPLIKSLWLKSKHVLFPLNPTFNVTFHKITSNKECLRNIMPTNT